MLTVTLRPEDLSKFPMVVPTMEQHAIENLNNIFRAALSKKVQT